MRSLMECALLMRAHLSIDETIYGFRFGAVFGQLSVFGFLETFLEGSEGLWDEQSSGPTTGEHVLRHLLIRVPGTT